MSIFQHIFKAILQTLLIKDIKQNFLFDDWYYIEKLYYIVGKEESEKQRFETLYLDRLSIWLTNA